MQRRKKKPSHTLPAPCFLCGGPSRLPVHQRGIWRYFQCSGCGVVSLHPRPSAADLLKAYETYLPEGADDIGCWERMMTPVAETAVALIDARKNAKGARLLDVGCGYGFFLKTMAQKGWTVEGIEVSGPGREYARRTLGLSVHSTPLENMAFPEESFDVVTLFYVIEHLHDPGMILQEVCRILKPGGMVLLRWPHSTPVVRVLGPFAKWVDIYHTPFHLYDFNPAGMRRLLEKSGFGMIQHMIGGFTLPKKSAYRWSSILFGRMAEALYTLSAGRFLLPGVSKTTLGFKGYAANDSDHRR